MLAARTQGSFCSLVMPGGTSHPWVCATPLATPIVTNHKVKIDLLSMGTSFARARRAVPLSEGLGRAEVRYRRNTHRIVNRGEVGRLFLPLAASAHELFAFLLERVHPLPNDRSLIHSAFEAAVVVVILGHLGRTRGFEKFFELVVGELAHQAGVESPSFFANQRITQAVVCGQAFA